MRYEKGHKDTSRQRIMDVAAERFRSDGIAASGLAGIMSDAGLTNGAFYPHFKSKADLVRDSLAAAMEDQSAQLRAMVADGGLEAVIAAYLSPEHRDNPQAGCTLSALLPELARQPLDTRIVYMERILDAVSEMASALPGETGDREAKSDRHLRDSHRNAPAGPRRPWHASVGARPCRRCGCRTRARAPRAGKARLSAGHPALHSRSVASAIRDSAVVRFEGSFSTPRVSVLNASRLPIP